PAQVERVMMGRIELITDQQHEMIAKISQNKPASKNWYTHIPKSPARDRFFAGDNDAAKKLGVKVPNEYEAYLNLGRFRNALLHHELRRSRNPNLSSFALTYGLLTREMRKQLPTNE
ncbi:MAG: hypothetical protein ACR2NU_17075, partial [Aeoliella sp.]